MENDQAFTADANFEAASSSRSGQPDSREIHQGHRAVKADNGALEAYKDDDYEDTPLLSRSIEDDFASRRGSHASESDREEPQWSGARDFEGRPWWNTPSVYWLLPPFVLFTLAFGGIIVPKLNLIIDLICRDFMADCASKDPNVHAMPVIPGVDNEQCRQMDEVQRRVSRFTLWMSIIPGILSAITSPKLGTLSDRYGRTKIIALTGVGTLVAELLTIFVAKNPDMVSVNWILVGYAIDGLCGTFIAAMAVTFAYASDCTAPARRSVVFGYFHGCLFGGIALGPLIAAYIVKATGSILMPFYVALACHATFFLFLGFIVPESLSKDRQKAAREKHGSIMVLRGPSKDWLSTIWGVMKGSNVFASLKVLWPTGKGTNRDVRRNLVLLAAVDTTMFGVAMGSMSIILIYAEKVFNWGNFETSVFQSVVNICRVTNLLVFLPLIVRLFRGPKSKQVQQHSGSDNVDLYIIRAAIAFDMLGYIGYTTVRVGPLFIVSGALASIGGMGSPTLSSAMTKHVPPDRTGQLLGAMGLLHAMARVVAPTIFNNIYFYTVGKFTQTVFVCLAGTFGAGFIMSWFIKPHVHWDEPNITIENDDGIDDDHTRLMS